MAVFPLLPGDNSNIIGGYAPQDYERISQASSSSSFFGDLGPLVPVGLALFAPGIGSAVGAALGLTGTAAAVVGSAIVNGALAEAQGGDFADGAVKGAISAGVAPAVAQTVGSSVANLMQDSAVKNVVANAVGSAATGAVTAALTGGDVEQAAKTGALAGAGGATGRELGTAAELGTTPFSEQTQQLAGQTVGMGTPGDFGAVLGSQLAQGVDPAQAVVNALATAQGQKSAATGREVKEPAAQQVTEAPVTVPGAENVAQLVSQPGVQVAQLSGGIAFPTAEEAKKLQEQGIQLPQTDVQLAPESLAEVTITATPEEIAAAQAATEEPTAPAFTQEPVNILDLIAQQRPEFAPQAAPELSFEPVSAPVSGEIPTEIPAQTAPVDTTVATAPEGALPPTQEIPIPEQFGQVYEPEVVAGPGAPEPSLIGGEEAAPVETLPETVVTAPEVVPEEVPVEEEFPAEEVVAEEVPAEEIPVEEEVTTAERPTILERPYISGGRRPTMGPTVTTLGQALSPAFFPSAPVSGLTSYRGAGEIESPTTGKPRRNVWNEASLRLKDALGL